MYDLDHYLMVSKDSSLIFISEKELIVFVLKFY